MVGSTGWEQGSSIAFVRHEHVLDSVVVELRVLLRQVVRHLFNLREVPRKTVIGSQPNSCKSSTGRLRPARRHLDAARP